MDPAYKYEARIEKLRTALEALFRCGQKQNWHNGAYEEEMKNARAILDEEPKNG